MEANSKNNENSDFDNLKKYIIEKNISEVKFLVRKKDKSILKNSNIRSLIYILNDRGLGKNYKLKNNYEYFSLVSELFMKEYSTFNEIKKKQRTSYTDLNLLISSITRIFNGHKILSKLDSILNFSSVNDDFLKKLSYHSFFSDSVFYGTLPTYLFWRNIIVNIKDIDSNTELVNSIGNSDDRIFKYVLKNFHSKINLCKTDYETMFRNLFTNNIPNKYILRRIKLLSNYLNLEDQFTNMITFSFSIGMIDKLMKYYYKKPVDIYHFFVTVAYNSSVYYSEKGENEYKKLMIKVYEKLISDHEKNMLILTSYMYSVDFALDEKISSKIKFKPMNNFFSYFTDLRDIEFSRLLRSIFTTLEVSNNNIFSNKETNRKILNLLNFLSSNRLFFDYIFGIICSLNNRDKLLKMILPFCSYLKITDIEINNAKTYVGKKCPCCSEKFGVELKINMNKITHYLRLYIKRYRKNKIIQKKVYFYDVLNEVVNYTPNPRKNILSKGSLTYRNTLTRFNEIPPHNLHIGEIDKMDNLLIRMKADGVYSKILPVDIYPSSNDFKNYKIKSEYIEELDLYLVFDIDIPDMNIIERYKYLRSIHSHTNFTTLSEIKNYNDLILSIKKEKTIFDNFLKRDYDNYRWYPKASWVIYNISNILKKELISNVILENDINNLDSIKNFTYNCDGLILTPLDGTREIKLKPKSLMTIDLLHNDGKWVDNNNNCYNSIVKSNHNLKNNKIYRCYPNGELYIPKEIRFDKKKPNPYSVVSKIIKLTQNDWDNDIIKNVYYGDNKTINKTINKVSKFNNYILKEIIKYINPMINSNWLDLGCGFGKLFSFIKMYNPNMYLGLDNDVSVINSCLRRYGKSLNYDFNFCPCNLGSEWNDHEQNWYEIKFEREFDYLVCNFSLMHFCNDKFWTQVNKVAKKNSYMILNLVNDKSSNKFINNKTYLYHDKNSDKVKYFFEGINKSEVSEDFISSQMIENITKKYNWEIIKKFNVSKDFLNETKNLKNNSLELYYDWYVLKLNI
jgi:SAM-dependent methyltransferase